MAAMRVALTVKKTRYLLYEPIIVTISAVNDGREVAHLRQIPLRVEHRVGDRIETWREQGGGPPVAILPGGTVEWDISFEMAFETHFRERAAIEPFAYECSVELEVECTRRSAAAHFDLEVDFRETKRLLAPSGEPSRYIVEGEKLVYISHASRAYESPTRVLKGPVDTARVLDPQYLVAGKAVYCNGRAVRGADASSFRVLNAVYAKDRASIFTPYGDAKVEDPESFEVLDEGDSFIFHDPSRPGYRAGFGRDLQAVYFFDESVDTKHAKRVKGAVPQSFLSLGMAYGTDGHSVYVEHRRLKGADSATFHRISHWFWADRATVFCGGAALAGVRPSEFEVIDLGGGSWFSQWGRVGDRYFERSRAATAAEYETACKRAALG